MKTLINAAITILAAVGLMFIGRYYLQSSQGLTGESNIVNFYNWGDYIDPDLIDAFEEETGYVVVYETFDSNEAMLTKIQQGGTNYDLIGPSEYMVENMLELNLLEEIDHDKLPNLKHIDKKFLDQSFDPGNQYSVPYFWGTLGILYDTSQIPEGEITSWNDLWKDKYRNQIMIIDGAREVIGIGLQSEGHSLNETDSQLIEQATAKMKTLMPNILALLADEIKMYASIGEAPIAITYSGEAATAMDENEDLAYMVPKEGSNIWFDTLAIPKGAKNVQGAHALMDFLMRPDIAARNAEYIGYATPNKDAIDLMDPEVINDPAFYPPQEITDHLEIYRNLGQEKLIEYNDEYLRVKLEPRY
ncbi:ABC transporter substrate-binding protein [Facklamia miroungae]|uniref:Spermidine/putrescine transport system substrate-binding protein n=1 Tax=Facklamia miroungae TaxID=120956 RepID=A0A1G7RJB4_9LACT|nr:ABC transporter substrate-binding protein [Facklamia miroungae]NKZ29413.1 ABC transporter substrate-binding protein [Facklamia miroungae]SDG10150.1 spermidine/putrescine transport system substrate-binding protein [Facklamia miroungae]